MRDLVELPEIITADDLLKRWTALTDYGLADYIDQSALGDSEFPKPYFLFKTTEDPISKVKSYFCEPITFKMPYGITKNGPEEDNIEYEFTNISTDGTVFMIVFSEEDVKIYEDNNKLVRHIVIEQLYADKTTFREDFEANANEVREFATVLEDKKHLEQQLADALHEIERLKASGPQPYHLPQDCATCKEGPSHAKDWELDVECAVRLACTLAESKEPGSTEYHRSEWEALRGAARKRAFEAFRRGLSDNLKEPDPRKQKSIVPCQTDLFQSP